MYPVSKLDELIKTYCPNGTPHVKFGDVIILVRGTRLVKSELSSDSGFPVYQNSLKPLGFHTNYNCPKNSTFIICAGAAGEIGYSEKEYWSADDCFYCKCPENVSSRYLFHILLNNQHYLFSRVRKASIPRLSRTFIESMTIPLPPIEVQEEIVRILDSFTALTAELTAELIARKKQYEFYLDKLLSFEGFASWEKKEIEVKWMKLRDLFPHIRNGFVGTVTPYFTDSENGVRYLEGTNIHDGVISDNEILYVTRDFHKQHIKNELKCDDILMVQSGHIGECAVVGEKYAGSNCHALIIMSNGGLCNSKYVCHYFHTKAGFKQLTPAITGGTIQHVLAKKVQNVIIPVPPIEVQNKIVEILDRLQSLCIDLESGLPAEIDARQKQYKYYRDKLLTFQGVKA